jgi:cardiolipin synthase
MLVWTARMSRRFKHRKLVVGILIGLAVTAGLLMIAQDQETLRIRTALAAGDERFPQYLARLLGRPLLVANPVRVLTDGEATYAAMLEAIGSARERVSFETYVFSTGEVAAKFTEAFAAAARRGVQVYLVLDSVGAGDMDPDQIKTLESAGVKIGWFNPLSGYSLEELNYRTHRKILVVDGTRAFVGGVGIADQWMQETELPTWRDTHVELDGQVAAAIEGGFNENWIESGGVVDPIVEPIVGRDPGVPNTIVEWSSPEGGANGMKLLYLLAIAAARTSIDIQSPYLIVDESSFWSLTEARQRGVRVRLLVEGDLTDARSVKHASRGDYQRLLDLGIEIAEFQPTMMHVKAMVIDGVLSIVGSANFDNRSLELNDELNVAVFDRALARQLLDDFETDWGHSKVLTAEEWRQRPTTRKLIEWFWSFFGEVF